jgi:hypothetical protein
VAAVLAFVDRVEVAAMLVGDGLDSHGCGLEPHDHSLCACERQPLCLQSETVVPSLKPVMVRLPKEQIEWLDAQFTLVSRSAAVRLLIEQAQQQQASEAAKRAGN